jgi:PhnB protein
MLMTDAASMQFAPYVFFYGKCREALEFYTSVFGGSYEAMRVGDSPMKDQVPPEAHDAIMHATFTAPGITFMCADGREQKTIDPEAGNVALALTVPDAEASRIFDALARGGEVTMPLAPAFWGARFGIVNDRFGTQWMVNGQ